MARVSYECEEEGRLEREELQESKKGGLL